MVIFSNGSKRSLQHLMAFLSLYEKESDHLINMEVSCYIVEGGGGNLMLLDVKLLKKLQGLKKSTFL